MAKAWVLFYLAATLLSLTCAWYSRAEAIQKVAACIFPIFVGSHVFDGTAFKVEAFIAMDVLGMIWCAWIWWRCDPPTFVPRWVGSIFSLMILTHIIGHTAGIAHDYALSALYILQLTTLSGYAIHYGNLIRKDSPVPDEPFYRAVPAWLTIKS